MNSQNILSRRTVLKGAPVAIAATMLPLATVHAYSVPVEAHIPAEFVNHPWVKARSLAWALADTLSELASDNDHWIAHVEPADRKYAVMFEALDWRTPYEQQEFELKRFTKSAQAVDPSLGGWTCDRDVTTGAVVKLVREQSQVRVLMERHRTAQKVLKAANARYEELLLWLEENPRYEPVPKVQVGVRVRGFGQPDEPIYAYDVAAVEKHSLEFQNAISGWPGRDPGAVKTKFDQKRAELECALHLKKKMERAAGLPAALASANAAGRAADIAAVVLILAVPQSSSEAARKANYMRGKVEFKADWWNGEDLFDALMAVTKAAGAA